MTTPSTAPGSVPPPMDDTARRIRALEQRVDELSRRDLSNAQVGQGGRLRGLYGNGNEAFQFGRDPVDGENKAIISYSDGTRAIAIGPGAAAYGAQETMVMRDVDGNVMLSMDEFAGAGLSNPTTDYAFGILFEGSGAATLTGGTQYTVADAGFIMYHPALLISALVKTSASWTARVRLVDGLGNELATSSTTPTQGGTQYVTRAVPVPVDQVGVQNVKLQLRVTPVATTTDFTVYPRFCRGISLGYYNLQGVNQ